MRCSEAREALSARYDGEPVGVDAAQLRAHVAGCPECAAFERSLGQLGEVVLAAATPPPAHPARPLHRRRMDRTRLALRLSIVVLALVDLGTALTEMFGETDHESHESASFTVALCVALAYAAARPALARAYVPVLGVASLLLVATSTADVGKGRIALGHELPHVGLVIATVLLWLLAAVESGPPPWWRWWRRRHPLRTLPRPSLRVVTRAAAALLVASMVALLPGSASAHAVLEASTPRPDSVVRTLPSRVTLRYDEAVTVLPGSLRVYGPDGSRVDRGDVGHRAGHAAEVGVSLGAGSGQGTYLVSWRVISADSHPVSGAFTFSVGRPSATPVAPSEQSSKPLGVALGAARWVGYTGSALLVGVLLVLGWCWREGWSSSRVRRLMATGGVLLGVGAVADVLLKGPYDAALGVGATFHADLLREVLGSTYGHATVARFVLALAGLALVRLRIASRAVAALFAVLVGLSFALAGHAAAGSGHVAAAINDTVHVVAASAWLGGLVLLLVAVLPHAAPAVAGAVARRFSGLALGTVVLLAATGLYQAVRQVGSVHAATATTYGRELLVKVGVVLVTVVVAAVSRGLVQRSVGTPGRLRTALAAETALLAVVLAITSALVATEPAKTAYHPTTSASMDLVGDTVQVSAVPAGNRTVELHLYVFGKDQQPSDPKEITASVSLPTKSIDALPVQLQNAGPGHRQAILAVPVAGQWRLAVTVRTTAIDEATGYVTVPIR